jgi:hypothetical protein
MQSARRWVKKNVSGAIDGARRIFSKDRCAPAIPYSSLLFNATPKHIRAVAIASSARSLWPDDHLPLSRRFSRRAMHFL